MDSVYWTIDSSIIFKPEFNNKFDNYYSIISKYTKLIFSDYRDKYTAEETIYNKTKINE